jgi:hypothetical protein
MLLIRHIYSLILQQIEELVGGDVECSVVDASLDAIKDLFSHWSEEKGAEQLMCGGGVMIGAGMYRALWRWIERAGGGRDLLLVMGGRPPKNIEWHKLVVCQERVILRYFTYDGQK